MDVLEMYRKNLKKKWFAFLIFILTSLIAHLLISSSVWFFFYDGLNFQLFWNQHHISDVHKVLKTEIREVQKCVTVELKLDKINVRDWFHIVRYSWFCFCFPEIMYSQFKQGMSQNSESFEFVKNSRRETCAGYSFLVLILILVLNSDSLLDSWRFVVFLCLVSFLFECWVKLNSAYIRRAIT